MFPFFLCCFFYAFMMRTRLYYVIFCVLFWAHFFYDFTVFKKKTQALGRQHWARVK